MFLDAFPTTFFEISPTNRVIVTDFLRAIRIDPMLKENPNYYKIYEMQDGDTPEIISHKFYGTTAYHWIIMVLNEKFDPWRDFPQSDDALKKYATSKYVDINAIHHYEDSNGNWIDVIDGVGEFHIPITNIEYEFQLNEKKRTIKILDKAFISEFVNEYNRLIGIN